jgi:pre-mRNA-splicing helicase BRR2
MGARAGREAPKDLEKKKQKQAVISAADEAERSIRRRGDQSTRTDGRYLDILQATEDLEGLNYRPKTAETREVFELLLGIVHQALGDQAQDVVRSATDTVLEILKSEDVKEFDRKKEVETITGTIDGDRWSQLVNLAKKITDYAQETEDTNDTGDLDPSTASRAVEGEDGVAVLFEDDEDEDEGEGAYELRDDNSDEEESNDDEPESGSPADGSPELGNEDLDMVIGDASHKQRKGKQHDVVAPHDVDGFWLQRLITSAYSDPQQANELTTKTLDLLASDMDLRDLENSLAEVFGYANFEIVALLTKNRETVVWCTKLARTDDDDRHDVEVAMREKGLGWLLRALAGDRSRLTETVPSRPQAGRSTIESAAVTSSELNSRSQRTVDIEGLIFAQGGHLMSNKKVKLPTGSFKRTGKGYEEIHVPIPEKRKVTTEELPVQIASLPVWTHPVWGKTTQLNPVQSKVFPVAFESDEPMLLCAPTGAGKVGHTDCL